MGVSVRQQKRDGKWYLFVRHAGERESRKYKTEEEANAIAAAVRHKIALGEYVVNRPEHSAPEEPAAARLPTLKEFFDKTMSPLWESTLAPATYTRYETSFRVHIIPAIGETVLDEFTRDQVKKFVVSLLRKTAPKRTHGEERQAEEIERKLSKDSIRNIIAALRGAFTEAVEHNLLVVNPASRMGKFYKEAGAVRDEVDTFTAEEIPLLLNATLDNFGFESYALTLAALHTGMRASELAGVQWQDVDFRHRFITVRRQFKDGKESRTKTKKARKVDISDALLKELQILRKRRQEEYLGRGKNELPPWVFLSPGNIIWEEGKQVGRTEGQPVDMVNFRNRVLLKACDKAGIRRRRLHDTRHTFASILLMAGESPAYVRDQLGHASIKMTVDVYGHFIPGANRQAVNKLPSLLAAPQADVRTPAAAGR